MAKQTELTKRAREEVCGNHNRRSILVNELCDIIEAQSEAIEGVLEGMDKPAVRCEGEWQTGMFCGLEDRDITDRYDACVYGYETAIKKVKEWAIGHLEAALAKEQK
uniref:Uncharacterized protein n=1 Tax=viral metagenome TaxID=1070528 RepID=A0A6M3XHA3_9ZZZZ